MPYQPAWFHRLDEILETLRAMESSHLDRRAVQKLFGVRERRARGHLTTGISTATSQISTLEEFYDQETVVARDRSSDCLSHAGWYRPWRYPWRSPNYTEAMRG